jgi:hypothetical protein
VTNLTSVASHHGGLQNSQIVFSGISNTTYRMAVGGFNKTMGDFNLYWNQSPHPYFCEHPQSTNVVAGESVTFNALAIGQPAPTYQWLSNGVTIASATNAQYTIESTQQTDTNQFYFSAVASNSHGSVISQVALLTVHHSDIGKIADAGFTSEGYFTMHVHGVTNRLYSVETATNLNETITWVPIFTNYVSFNYTNYMSTNDMARFYRVATVPEE